MTRPQVVIIDDDPDSSDVLAGLLDSLGVETLVVARGDTAQAELERTRPALAIIDLQLPGLNGWQVLERMRQAAATETIPAITVTAFSSDEVLRRAHQVGFIACLAKPVRVEVLYKTIREVVAHGL